LKRRCVPLANSDPKFLSKIPMPFTITSLLASRNSIYRSQLLRTLKCKLLQFLSRCHRSPHRNSALHLSLHKSELHNSRYRSYKIPTDLVTHPSLASTEVRLVQVVSLLSQMPNS